MTVRAPHTDLLHELVRNAHAEGVTALAVAARIDQHGRVLLLAQPGPDFIDDTWQLPTGPFQAAQTLTDAVTKSLAAIGLNIDEVTGYLGHHDHEDADAQITRVFCFAVTLTDPSSLCRSGHLRHWWAEPADLNKTGSPPGPETCTPPAVQAAFARPETRDPPLAAALRAGAHGLFPAEAGTELLINHASWLHRSDFRDRYVHTSAGIADVDWPDVITALDTGDLPCSGGEARILRLAASLTGGIPVNLRDALTGLDTCNIALVSQAVLHADGRPAPAH